MSRPTHTPVRELAIHAAIAAAYLTTGRLGLALAWYQENTTLMWPPTGIALAALVLLGPRYWPGVALGAALVPATLGSTPLVVALVASGNTLEAVVGAALLRAVGFQPALERMRDVLWFFGAVTASATISATLGATSLWLQQGLSLSAYSQVWVTWWFGNVGGAAVMGPLLLVGVGDAGPWRALLRRTEAWVVLALLLTTLGLAFGDQLTPVSTGAALFAYPWLVWAGLRLGPRGAVLAASLTATVAVIGTAFGHGPFAAPVVGIGSMQLWMYAVSLGTSAMLLAAAIAEREAAERARRAEEARRAELEARVQRAQRLESLAALAGGIAHDFNTLLTAIRGHAELARLANPSPDVVHSLDGIDGASERAAALCEQLLTCAGRNPPRHRSVDVEALARDLDRVLAVNRSPRITVTFEPGEVPPVRGDPAQLGQALMNLLTNAAEAIGDLPGHITVRTRLTPLDPADLNGRWLHAGALPGTYVELEVEDDGPGMPTPTQARLFEPFFTTKVRGRGLGLPTVLGVVQAHGGALEVVSAPGAGTRFRLLLPPYDPTAQPSPHRSVGRGARSAGPDLVAQGLATP